MVREKKHPPYYALKGYQLIKRISDERMAEILEICVRSYRDKRDGYSDFSIPQAQKISEVLDLPTEEIFLT